MDSEYDVVAVLYCLFVKLSFVHAGRHGPDRKRFYLDIAAKTVKVQKMTIFGQSTNTNLITVFSGL